MRVWWVFWILIGGCDNSLPDDPDQDGNGSVTPEQDVDADADPDADADADADADQEDIAIKGAWVSEDYRYTFDNNTLTTFNSLASESEYMEYEIESYDNSETYLIWLEHAQSVLFRVDWFIDSNQALQLCFHYTPSTPEDLAERPQPNTNNTSMGCHGEPWFEIRKPIDISGVWANHEETMTIREFTVSLSSEIGNFKVISANQEEGVMFTDGMFYWDGLVDDQQILISWMWRAGEYLACFSPESLWDGPAIDETNLQTGCSGRQWWPLRKPISVRGKYQPLGVLPTHLFEVDSATVLPRAEDGPLTARWRTTKIDYDDQTMVLGLKEADVGIEVPEGSQYIKIQWAEHDDTGDQYLCVLDSGASEAAVKFTPPEAFSIGGSCGIADLGAQATWVPLIPE